mmetsp:Transcript_16713/g.39188  ORF Transcript_16713/g.39188 Transcript_16713/m.39188 type:complete len:201 (+) Transcript_16713:338-940(+)
MRVGNWREAAGTGSAGAESSGSGKCSVEAPPLPCGRTLSGCAWGCTSKRYVWFASSKPSTLARIHWPEERLLYSTMLPTGNGMPHLSPATSEVFGMRLDFAGTGRGSSSLVGITSRGVLPGESGHGRMPLAPSKEGGWNRGKCWSCGWILEPAGVGAAATAAGTVVGAACTNGPATGSFDAGIPAAFLHSTGPVGVEMPY